MALHVGMRIAVLAIGRDDSLLAGLISRLSENLAGFERQRETGFERLRGRTRRGHVDRDLIHLDRLALGDRDMRRDQIAVNFEAVSDMRVVVAMRLVEQPELIEIAGEGLGSEFRPLLP